MILTSIPLPWNNTLPNPTLFKAINKKASEFPKPQQLVKMILVTMRLIANYRNLPIGVSEDNYDSKKWKEISDCFAVNATKVAVALSNDWSHTKQPFVDVIDSMYFENTNTQPSKRKLKLSKQYFKPPHTEIFPKFAAMAQYIYQVTQQINRIEPGTHQ